MSKTSRLGTQLTLKGDGTAVQAVDRVQRRQTLGWWVFADQEDDDLPWTRPSMWDISPSVATDPSLLSGVYLLLCPVDELDTPETVGETPTERAFLGEQLELPGIPAAPLGDVKESLTSARKADITHVRTPFLVYTSRQCEYGNAKYPRANYLRTQPTLAADFKRFRAYLRAAVSHTMQVLDAMELHQSQDPDLADIEGMKRACYAVDTDAQPGAAVGASGLPHVAGGCASLMMAVTQAVNAGLIPADPGTPWVDQGIRAFSSGKDPK